MVQSSFDTKQGNTYAFHGHDTLPVSGRPKSKDLNGSNI